MTRAPLSRRGSTLALVLWTLVVAGGVSLAVSTRSRSAIAVASNARAHVIARYAAESGLTIAVRAIEESLSVVDDSSARAALLNTLPRAPFPLPGGILGAARMALAISDESSKLDLNYADADAVAQLLSEFGDAGAARHSAAAIRAHIGTGVTPDSPDESFPIGQSTAGTTFWSSRGARYLTSLDDLMAIPDVDLQLLERAAPYLTVDGDGTTNRATAPAAVLRVASGALVDSPNRLLLVSRGWLEGSSLTHEIQAVYAVQGNNLDLVRWRERTR